MIKNLLQIVPYIATHGKIILANQMNHVLMDKDAQFDGDAKELEQNGLAYTCIINNRICRNENSLEWCSRRLGTGYR